MIETTDVRITEAVRRDYTGNSPHELVRPNRVRINGSQVRVASEDPIIVHDMGPNEPVRVTLTLMVDSLVIEREVTP